MKRVVSHIKRLPPQRGLTIPCDLPTLAEAAERFQKTGEFILSARETNPDDFDGDDSDKALLGNIPQYVDKIESMLNEKDVNNMLSNEKKDIPSASAPAPAVEPTETTE